MKCIRAEGPAGDPAKGKALENGDLPRNSLSSQQFALPWAFNAVTGWAFGPNFVGVVDV
ncbi:MAG: hypothetical protein WCJ35_02315 [Planctomycetota bacterium]